MTKRPTNTNDVIDSRDILNYIEEHSETYKEVQDLQKIINQYSRTIGPSMAPLELLSKRQAVVFKAPCAYIGPPAIYIGLEPLSAKKKIHIFLLTVRLIKKYGFFVLAKSGSRPI